ncbi:MAG: UvrD-helicase domain-containing protein [Solirubrobacterales bacterium]
MTRSLTDQQRAAVANRDRDVFLRAGAGTGKTKVLVERFCAAALDPEIGIERLLAFTFTERAADQLRRRVREELEPEIDTDRAWISTIHGFCRRVLASHPAAAGIDPRFRVLDDPEADRLAGRAFDAALEQLVAEGDADALEFAAANRRRTLLEMARGAYDELRSHGDPAPRLPAPPPVDAGVRIGELIEAASEAHDECAEASGKGLDSRRRIGAAMELDPALPPSAELIEKLRGLEIRSRAGAFRGPACERYSRALKRARSAVAAQVLAPAYEQLRELVAGFGRRYEELKSERSALDFEDLQLKTVELLSSSEWLRDRYREQFRHLMVDEFQDTNALQLRLIRELRGPETRLFLVGDEFQSIYGFRHADIEVYRREHRRFAEGEEPNGEALPLTGNFRAAPELVAATNAIGEALLGDFEPLTAAVKEPAPGSSEAPVELLLTEDRKKEWEAEETKLPRPHDDPSSGSKVAEARRLAARLRELVDRDPELSAADVVVLLRAFTHVSAFQRALGEAGLDPYVVGGRGFWSQQQIEDLRCLLAVIANPLDDEALFGALASPACAVLPDTLWLLRRTGAEPGEDGRDRLFHVWPLLGDLAEGREPHVGDAAAAALIPEDELRRLREFVEILQGLRELGTEGGLETLVDRVATAFDYDLATLGREDGTARWANVRKLLRLAREFEAREGPDLGGFLEYLDNRAASRDREAEAASRAEGHAGVRVMTVHAAKGLEFEVVAVADLGRNLQLGWTPLRVAPGEAPDGGEATRVGVQLGRLGRPGERLHDYEELTELATEREAEEERRLAYVAATRARRRLLLSGTFNPKLKEDKLDRQPITQQLIHGLLGGDAAEREVRVPAADAPGAPDGRLAVEVCSPGPGVGEALLAPREAEPEPAETEDAPPPLGRPATPPALIGGLSYSALNDFERCGYRFYVERVLGIGEPEGIAVGDGSAPEAKRRFGPGVAVHSLLEWSARNGWRDPGSERAAATLGEQGLEPSAEEIERSLALVGGWLGSPLREELADGRASAEVPFVLSVRETMLRGSIDLLVERPDGSVLVVDYKTDRLDGADPHQAAGRYGVQRDLYALAAAGRGAPVETAYVFLERPELPVRERFDGDALSEARARTEALLDRLAAGRFPVTDGPHRALCRDCPARERLCIHGAELTMRDSPLPPASMIAPAEGEPQLTLLEGG